VAIESTFQDLVAALYRAEDVFTTLGLTIREDRPAEDAVPIEQLGEAIDDVVGWLHNARVEAIAAHKAVVHPIDAYRVRQALAGCQERVFRATGKYAVEIVSYERLGALSLFCNERDIRWRVWAPEALEAVEGCREPLDEVARALLACWQELTERLSSGGVTVQSTSVGQQISVPNAREFMSGAT
jgi:hypothetical protein